MRKAKEVLSRDEIVEIIEDTISTPVIDMDEVYKNNLREIMYKCNKYFDYDFLDEVEIKFDKRLTSIGGNCRSRSRVIKISPHYIRIHPEELEDIIIHEMIHLEIGGHGVDFYDKMNEINKMAGRKVVSRYTAERANTKYITYCTECNEVTGTYSKKTRHLKNGTYFHGTCGTHVHAIEVEKYV